MRGKVLFPEGAGVDFADFVLHYCHVGVVTSGMGAKKKTTCGLVRHVLR